MQENNGQLSSTRLFPMIITLCMAVDWMHAIFTVGLWHPDIEVIALFLGAIGAKIAQKPFEEKKTES